MMRDAQLGDDASHAVARWTSQRRLSQLSHRTVSKSRIRSNWLHSRQALACESGL